MGAQHTREGANHSVYDGQVSTRVRVAVIGAPEGVRKVLAVGRSYAVLDLEAYPYDSAEDAPTLVAQLRPDVFFFCGPVPWELSRDKLPTGIPAVVIPFGGSGLAKAIHLLSRQYPNARRFSLDTLSAEVAQVVAAELAMGDATFVTPQINTFLGHNELVSFHLEEWHNRTVDACITCLGSVRRSLGDQQVPCVCVEPMTATIQETLERAILWAEKRADAATQLAVLLISVRAMSSGPARMHDDPLGYRRSEQELLLHQGLLELGRSIEAAVFHTGEQEFGLYTTRAGIEQAVNWRHGTSFLHDLALKVGIDLAAGIGFGWTALDANKNARLGLERSRHSGGLYVVTRERRVIGPIAAHSSNGSLATQYLRVEHPGIQHMAERAQVAPRHLLKLLITSRQRPTFTVSEAGEVLNVAERSARRILQRLAETDVLEVVAKEQLSQVGRPAQVYRFKEAVRTLLNPKRREGEADTEVLSAAQKL